MSRAANPDRSWRQRLGTNPWRNLIAAECEVIERLNDCRRLRTTVETDPPRPAAPTAPNEVAFGWRWRDASHIAVKIALVGRTILCEPSLESIVAQSDDNLRRLYVIPLSWNPRRVAGLTRLLSGSTPITVVTSWWVWEESVPALSTAGLPHRTLAEVEAGGENETEHGLLGFNESIQLDFGAGVEIRIESVPCSVPALKAVFFCNGQRIVVTASDGIETHTDTVRALVWQRVRSYPALHEAFRSRYGSLAPRASAGDPPVFQADHPVNTRMLGEKSRHFSLRPRTDSAPPVETLNADDTLSDRELLQQTAFAVFCGGADSAREWIDPGRQLEVRLPGAKRQRVVSILAWRLTQLSSLADGMQRSLTVLLVVSAYTERIVRDEIDRLGARVRDRLNIVLLRQQLVPRVFESHGRRTPVAGADGGWALAAPGHLDLLSLLSRFNGAAQGLRRCMAFAHNNLGALLLDSGAHPRLHPDTRRVLAADWKALLAVEVFELERTSDDDIDRTPLSFIPEAMPGRLVKRGYPGLPSQLVPTAYSSHTWYIDLTRLDHFAPHSQAYLLVDGWPRQEMEQVTHSETTVRFIAYDAIPNRTGWFAHPRFLVARTEDTIRNQHFLAAFDEAHGRADGEPEPVDEPLLILAPAEMKKVWAGDRLRARKGMPPAYVGETWELSTHPGGPSAVHLNMAETLPLSELLRRDDPDRPHLPVMAKYLDCERPLSIQVHPDADAVAALEQLRSVANAPRIRLADKGAKEESFFVLEPAGTAAKAQQCHLLLGFAAKALAPIADALENTSEVDQLIETLRRAVLRHVAEVLNAAGIEHPAALTLPDCNAVRGALAYHIARHATPGRARQAAAAVGVIWMIWSLARSLPATVAGAALFEDLDSPLLRHFRHVTVQRNQWVRVAPGIVHSWQGGGNLTIELSHRSDNTFRILDYGRELRRSTARPMHYLEAMYALTSDSVMDDEAVSHCLQIVNSQEQQCHALLSARLMIGGGHRDWIALSDCAQRSFVLNPDGQIHLRTEATLRREITLGPCRAALIAPNAAASVLIARPGDRILHFRPCQEWTMS